ncbi:hypothetical protein OEZ85_007414 [Tetradesmus obliquus]|uniref:Uncharacterized protein n=1 Tax=Tetradesmus obliquus TaxID=3088 RepID=A0ABY8TJD5_TETOB|nr:hypothetical protein OEZ85_007414 [Tetradesmus obliquus]
MEQNQLLDCIDIRLEPHIKSSNSVQGGSPASRLLASEQQQQQQQALQQLASKVHHHVALARSSPGLRASSESIISEANPGGGSSCHDARSRRFSKDGSGPSDPLYRVRKTDRVARFQKMQQAWQKDRYLNTGASRNGPSGISSSRPATTPSVRSKPSWED